MVTYKGSSYIKKGDSLGDIIRRGRRKRDPSYGVGDQDRRERLREEERRRGGSRNVADTDVADIERTVDRQIRAEKTEQAVATRTPGLVVVDRGGAQLNDVLTAEQRMDIRGRNLSGNPVNQEELGEMLKRTARERTGRDVRLTTPDGTTIAGSPGFAELVANKGREQSSSSRQSQAQTRPQEREPQRARTEVAAAPSSSDFFGLGTIEEQIEAQQRRKQEFAESPGIQRIEQTANLLTFGGGTPLEERSFGGQTAQIVTTGFLGFPIFAGELAARGAENAFITGRIIAREKSDTDFKAGLLGPFKDVEAGPFSFLPGGTPINPEGAATLASAGLLALLPAAQSTAQFQRTGVSPAGKPFKTETFTLETAAGPTRVTTFGLDVGTRGQPLLTIARSPGSRGILSSRSTQPGTAPEILFGSPRPGTRFSPTDLLEPTAQPVTAVGGRAFRNFLELTPEEAVRIDSAVRIARNLQRDSGLTVEDVLFRLETVENPARVSRIVEQAAAEEGGVFFGSTTTQQLPQGFQNVKVGDIDVVFPSRSVAQLEPVIGQLAKDLRGAGEKRARQP